MMRGAASVQAADAIPMVAALREILDIAILPILFVLDWPANRL
jgi:hypothetical protein